MKTEQILKRDEAFIQRLSDGYFNATNLVDVWNRNNPDKKKQLPQYKLLNSTDEFINQLGKEGIINPYIATRGKSVNAGTWMHPKLFIDFAMWISVEFKSNVIDYVIDGLIQSRHEAGDHYKEMCKTILETYVDTYGTKPPAHIYIDEAALVKSLVVVKDRNEMTADELRQLTYLQKFNSNLIKKRIGKESRIKRLKEAAEVII